MLSYAAVKIIMLSIFFLFCLIFNAQSAEKPDPDTPDQTCGRGAQPVSSIYRTDAFCASDRRVCTEINFQKVIDPDLASLGLQSVGSPAALDPLPLASLEEDSPHCIVLHAFAYDDLTKERRLCHLRFLTPPAENIIISAFIEQALEMVPDRTNLCLCTTLHSLPNFLAHAEANNACLHVAARKGCLEYQAPNDHVENDFTAIIRENKGKNTFMFLDSVGTSFLPAGEFLVQCAPLAHAGASLIVGFAMQQNLGTYNVGSIYYGEGSQRTEDRMSVEDRLILRAVQAERIAEGLPCDQRFMVSAQFNESYVKWLDFVQNHVRIIDPLTQGTDRFITHTSPTNLELADLSIFSQWGGRPIVLIGAPSRVDGEERAFILASAIKTFEAIFPDRPDARYIIVDSRFIKGTNTSALERSNMQDSFVESPALISVAPTNPRVKQLMHEWGSCQHASLDPQATLVFAGYGRKNHFVRIETASERDLTNRMHSHHLRS